MTSIVETAIRSTVTKGVMALASFNRKRMAKPDRPNPYLSGLNAPVDRELTLTDLKVAGSIPPELNGRYLRIGPNPIGKVHGASHHWFIGDGMVHGVCLKDGQAQWYRNRWIRSTAVSKALGEAPKPGPRHFSDTVNTNVLGHAGQIWGLVEAGGYPVRLDDELNTIAHDPFGGSLKGSFSAHPHRDVATGDMHAVCYEAKDPNFLRHVVVGADGRVKREEPIAVRHGPSVHDCMITRDHVIVLDLPVTFSMAKLVAGFGFPYEWNPEHRARVGVLKKTAPGSEIVWCDVEPCYVFHPCNGFETPDGKITLDVVAHKTMFDDNAQGNDGPLPSALTRSGGGGRRPSAARGSTYGSSANSSAFERWTIDPTAKRVLREVIDASPQEFPRPDERRLGQPYRYATTAELQRDGNDDFVPGSALIRHDLQSRTQQRHDFGAQRFVGEFVFVPKAAAATLEAAPEAASESEQQGWLMGYVGHRTENTTDLVILDAANFTGPPQAVVTIPQRIPTGFHGNWVPAN